MPDHGLLMKGEDGSSLLIKADRQKAPKSGTFQSPFVRGRCDSAMPRNLIGKVRTVAGSSVI